MTTLFIFILLILSIFFLLMRRLKSGIITLVITFIIFLLIGNGLIASMLLDQLQAPFVTLPKPQWSNKNVIVLLGAGAIKIPNTTIVNPTIMAYSRIYETARLYFSCIKSGKTCIILISGGDALNAGKAEAPVYREALLDLGIQNANISLEPNSLNTYKNAEFTSALIKKRQFEQVFLVTSGIHLKRSLLYFDHFGIHANPAIADYLTVYRSFIPIAYNFAMTDFAIHEYLGIFRFHLYNFLGWNNHVSSQGIP